MEYLQTLLYIYSALILVNTVFSFCFWLKYKHFLYRSMLFLWAGYFINFLLQGMLKNNEFYTILGFSSYILCSLTLGHILSTTSERISFPLKKFILLMGVAYSSCFVAHFFGLGFIAMALPIAIGVVAPMLYSSFKVLALKGRAHFSAKILSFVVILNSLHFLDYPFLGNNKETAIWGFSIALVLSFIFSIVLPAHIIADISEGYVSKLEDDLELTNDEIENASDYLELVDRKLIKKNANLEEAQKKYNILLGAITHDISNPLQIIYSYALSNERHLSKVDEKKAVENNSKIMDATVRIIEMTKKFKEMQNAGANSSHEVVTTELNMEEVFSDLNFIFSGRLEQKRIRFESDFPLVSIQVYGDRGVIVENILANLISNAIKFSYDNSQLRISLSDHDEKYFKLSLQDHGVGISKDRLESIFQFGKASSTNGTSGEKGTGFGLAIVKEYIEMFKGRIEVQSIEKEGAIFDLYLRKYKGKGENLSKKIGRAS